MALIKLSNNGVKNVSSLSGLTSSVGDLVFISKQTASSSASISFTSGIDSTYKEYVFYFVNMHSSATNVNFEFQGSTDGGSNYNTTITSTAFDASHREDGASTEFTYRSADDQAQGTNFQHLGETNATVDATDKCLSGYLHLFNPSSTTFVKHFLSSINHMRIGVASVSQNCFIGGYFNSTSAIDSLQFRYSSGNIDSGDILLYGVN